MPHERAIFQQRENFRILGVSAEAAALPCCKNDCGDLLHNLQSIPPSKAFGGFTQNIFDLLIEFMRNGDDLFVPILAEER